MTRKPVRADTRVAAVLAARHKMELSRMKIARCPFFRKFEGHYAGKAFLDAAK
jgi:hypothetical protein